MNPISLNTYRALPEHMFSDDVPLATRDPQLLILNSELLREYDVANAWFRSAEGLSILSGNATNSDNPPIAMAYVGHQFGHRAPMLGDGRAHMLGQMHTAQGNVDIQLKGSGATRFSRGGDGRATLASVLREHIVSEAMAGLGIPTTRSLAVITTGDTVHREDPEPGGISVRTAKSHIRVGSFEYAADQVKNQSDKNAVKALADYMIEQHFAEVAETENPYAELLLTVSELQAQLISQWMLVGFIHGVMNTDNMAIVGETIDFGPCAFMDEFNAEKVFSSIDRHGRYAWANQPGIGLWNLTRLAETLLPLLSNDSDTAVKIAETQLKQFMPSFQGHFYAGLRKKLGLPDDSSATNEFADKTLALLGDQSIDMTVFFDTLTAVASGDDEQTLLELFGNHNGCKEWLSQWHNLRSDDDSTIQSMRLSNPAIIARNHRVEEALLAATEHNDLQPALRLAEALRNPFSCSPENADLQTPPLPEERVTATFCGT